jgi:endonuclease-3
MENIKEIIHELKRSTNASGPNGFAPPLIDQVIEEYGKDPFLILIACLLSLRAKDVMTIHVVRDLFKHATTPQAMLKISRANLEKIVFRSGFYKNKARAIHEVSKAIIDRFGGKVPSTYQELISINGVGPKTANLVLGMAFDKPAICVDTHVHRICNRLGIIKTKTAEQTQLALETILPKKYWTLWNKLLVMWGQNICLPRGPKCGICAINKYCEKIGVKKL